MGDLKNKIILQKLKIISTIGGNVMHGIKSSDKNYIKFGELYFSWIEKDFVKAWKLHKKMTMNLIVPYGMVKFVFVDNENSSYIEKIIGEENYYKITVLPNTWFGFQGVGKEFNLIANLSNIKHDDNEVLRENKETFNYKW